MQRLLLGLGIAIIPFFSIGGFDSRDPKMMLSMVISLCLILTAVYYGRIGKCLNKWLLALLVYIPLCHFLAYSETNRMVLAVGKKTVSIPILIGWIPVQNFWIWKPMLIIFVFFLLYLSIKNLDLVQHLNIMVCVGGLLAVYGIVQYFNIDQFFMLSAAQHADNPRVAATLGQPTLLATFLAMLLPLSVYFRKWVCFALMAVVIVITKSQMALGASVVSLLLYLAFSGRKQLVLAVLLACVIGTLAFQYKPRVGDGDRFRNWKMIVADIKGTEDIQNTRLNRVLKQDMVYKNKYSLTGRGLGSFKYLFHRKHSLGKGKEYFEAHNEPLELTYCIGIIGLLLYLLAWFTEFRLNFAFSERKLAIMSALIAVNLCSLGLFVFHLGAHCFYTVVLLGALNEDT